MEVSTTSTYFPNINLTPVAIQVIQDIITLDATQRHDKGLLFKRLYDLWCNDSLHTTSLVKRQFETNREFIKQAIFCSFPLREQRKFKSDELIFKTLKDGLPFTTPEDRIIPPSLEELSRFRNDHKNNQQKLNYRFNCLVNKFLDYLSRKKNNAEENEEEIFPMKRAITRDIIIRDAKSKAQDKGFKGTTSNNTDFKRRKKTMVTMIKM